MRLEKFYFIVFFSFFLVSSLVFGNNTAIQKSYHDNRPKVGVVLSGGGAKGIAHVGILKALEDLNIPIDYIAGTSMGSIIGGLYAYGYSARQLDSILRAADWVQILSDSHPREYISLLEKQNVNSYQLSVDYQKNQKSLVPLGLIHGQRVYNLFYTLTADSYKTPQFKDLPIPFLCVGANILNGKELVLEEGNLAKAMRASMAIPSVFTPIEWDSTLLVDGGIINNFPADKLKDKGMDIIIGVNVGYSFGKKERLNNMMSILEASIFVHSKDRTMSNQELCDVLIFPETKKYSASSFGDTDSLLYIGYMAAQKAYPELQAIAQRLAPYLKDTLSLKDTINPDTNTNTTTAVCIPPASKKYYIQEVRYSGLDKYTKSYANQYLEIDKNSWVDLQDINEATERLYGTMNFKFVDYEFLPIDTKHPSDSVILNVILDEKALNRLQIGVRFDNKRSVALLAHTELANLGLRNSRLALALELSKIPRVDAEYLFMPNWNKKKYSKWEPNVGVSYNFYYLNTYFYSKTNRKIIDQEHKIQEHKINIFARSLWEKTLIGVGMTFEYNNMHKVFSKETESPKNINTWYAIVNFKYRYDDFNREYYPTKGAKINLGVSYHNSMRKDPYNLAQSYLTMTFQAQIALPIHRIVTMYPSVYLGSTLFRSSSTIPVQNVFVQGGNANFNIENLSDFPGLYLGQSYGNQMWNIKLNTQIEIFKNLYLSVRLALGKTEDELKNMFYWNKNIVYGGNLGLSYNTPFGPIGIALESSNANIFGVHFHVGYWF